MKKPTSITGRYQHYKGLPYEVIGLAFHSESLEEMVIYKSLYDSGEFPEGTVWVRPRIMFEENVTVEGKTMPRFSKLNADS
jgi:hypothetical protein